jgi:hypothetical protein
MNMNGKILKILNEHGSLSAMMLMRKFKCTYPEAIGHLHTIIDEYENVYLKMPGMITIKGREWPITKKKYIRSKYIDVTQA